ncbi:Oidioi.mRNA.OKI2018_I69.chr1.g3481.t1.cds [Oikopleura dioica]|uniref:Oidioi.mRNA.OKI2018_I69.chr1.g3481.t1.cds n=1 Tax=Oikopleura dioica TaxID=34765 RepID=A0ABN7SZN9_OIKDI|nr:Oidioi.mRNA.OKI2018_I69.chr1.g3481.t1.cds [Oikopleura dioica]
MVKDAQLLQEKARRKKLEDEEKAKATKKLKKNLTYEDWLQSKSSSIRRASATPAYNFDRRGSSASVSSERRESLPIIAPGRRGSLVSKHNPNRRLSHQEWDELKEEKKLAEAEKEALEIEKKIAEKRAAISKRRTSLKPTISTVPEKT